MKNTKLMVMVVLTFIITWVLLGTLSFLLSDSSLRDCLTENGLIFFLIMFGWIPSVIVGYDYHEKLNKETDGQVY